MTRRPVLPGASELFRRTDTPPPAPEVTELPSLSTTANSPSLRGTPAARRPGEPDEAVPGAPLTLVPGGAATAGDDLASFRTPAPSAPVLPPTVLTRGRPARNRPERAKHDEKITGYISAEDLVSLERARLALRAEHGVAADRGRIVREAVSVLLADLDEHGENSVLVRRLKAR